MASTSEGSGTVRTAYLVQIEVLLPRSRSSLGTHLGAGEVAFPTTESLYAVLPKVVHDLRSVGLLAGFRSAAGAASTRPFEHIMTMAVLTRHFSALAASL
jgi:hypothetical protein